MLNLILVMIPNNQLFNLKSDNTTNFLNYSIKI